MGIVAFDDTVKCQRFFYQENDSKAFKVVSLEEIQRNPDLWGKWRAGYSGHYERELGERLPSVEIEYGRFVRTLSGQCGWTVPPSEDIHKAEQIKFIQGKQPWGPEELKQRTTTEGEA